MRKDLSTTSMRGRDFCLLAGIAGIIAVCFLLRGIVFRSDAACAEIVQDGKVIGTVRLDGGTQDIRVETEDGGYNIVHVENGGVSVIDADCSGHDCMRQGTVCRTGESIICLPHRLTITVKSTDAVTAGETDGSGDEEIEYDAIVR